MKIIDMHCDTISELLRKKRSGSEENLYQNNGHIDIQRLIKGGALLQNFALFVNAGKVEEPLEEVLQMIDLYYEELEKNSEFISPVFTFQDVKTNMENHKISALLTVEEGAVCKGSPAYLRTLYRLGVRMMTLTWNYPNEIGFPNLYADGYRKSQESAIPFYQIADKENGLTDTGREIVTEMERLGMIIDVSHLSDAGFYDVLEITEKPFVASHSNARSISSWVRNMTDDMIRKLADRGGVIGLNFCPDFLEEMPLGMSNPGTIQGILRHAKHIVNTGGIGCLGLGSDFDGIDGHGELPDYSYLPQLYEAFLKEGFSISDIENIFYKNVMGIYRELL